jgi:L-threonylcarbamoyladenylate synthase
MTNGAPENSDTQQTALGILRSGGVVVLPTDTLPGFATAMSSQAGIKRIDVAKKVQIARPYVLLASSVEMVEGYVSSFGCTTAGHMKSVWPAPLSAVFRTHQDRSPWGTDTLAFRVPNVASLRELVEELGEPIVSTSVNISSDPPLVHEKDIRNQFGDVVDLIVAGDSTGKASTLIDFTGDKPVLLRTGDYAWAATGDSNPSN